LADGQVKRTPRARHTCKDIVITRAVDRDLHKFKLAVPATTGAEGAVVAERVRTAIECALITVVDLDEPLRVTASIGVAELNNGSLESGEALVARADAAVYEAKSSGRNRVVADLLQPAA